MIFTDGQPTQDKSIPSTIKDKAHTANAHAPVGFTGPGHCAGAAGCTENHNSAPHTGHGGGLTNHDVHVDHHDNCSAYYGGTAASNDVCWSNGSHYLDDVAYYAHTTDLRQATIPGINLDGSDATEKTFQVSKTSLSIHFMRSAMGRSFFKDAAKMGGFEDRNNNLVFDAGMCGISTTTIPVG